MIYAIVEKQFSQSYTTTSGPGHGSTECLACGVAIALQNSPGSIVVAQTRDAQENQGKSISYYARTLFFFFCFSDAEKAQPAKLIKIVARF